MSKNLTSLKSTSVKRPASIWVKYTQQGCQWQARCSRQAGDNLVIVTFKTSWFFLEMTAWHVNKTLIFKAKPEISASISRFDDLMNLTQNFRCFLFDYFTQDDPKVDNASSESVYKCLNLNGVFEPDQTQKKTRPWPGVIKMSQSCNQRHKSSINFHRPNTWRQSRDLSGRRISMKHAFSGGACNNWLSVAKSFLRSSPITSTNCFFNQSDMGSHYAAARLVNFCFLRHFSDGFFGRLGIGHWQIPFVILDYSKMITSWF